MIHKNSQETKDHLAGGFITPEFPFSVQDRWDRMGFLGAFAHYVISCMPGAIAEVGCGESSIYLGHVARLYGRKIYHCDIAADKILNPLTVDGYMTVVGQDLRENPPQGWFNIDRSTFFIGASDEFFAQITDELALTFIDGDHNYAQAKKDFINALVRTVDNGYILLHDTYPPSLEYTHEARCGDVYRLRQEIEAMPEVDCLTLTHGAAMGVGLTIVRKKPAQRKEWQQ